MKRLLGKESALIRSLLFLYPRGGFLDLSPIRDQRVIRIGFLCPTSPLCRLEQAIGECACFLCVLRGKSHNDLCCALHTIHIERMGETLNDLPGHRDIERPLCRHLIALQEAYRPPLREEDALLP